jgi:hypothetical protein
METVEEYPISKARIAGLVFVDETILQKPAIPVWWLPINNKESILHAKVFEAAVAGCDTIFIVIPWHLIEFYNQYMKTFEYVEDPLTEPNDDKLGVFPDDARRCVPVYTIPLHTEQYWQAFSDVYSSLYIPSFVNNITKNSESPLFKFEKFYFTFTDCLFNNRAALLGKENYL